MESIYGESIILILNAVIIAFLLTALILVGILISRILRKGVAKDRKQFEKEVIEKLEEITETQAEMKTKLDEMSGRL